MHHGGDGGGGGGGVLLGKWNQYSRTDLGCGRRYRHPVILFCVDIFLSIFALFYRHLMGLVYPMPPVAKPVPLYFTFLWSVATFNVISGEHRSPNKCQAWFRLRRIVKTNKGFIYKCETFLTFVRVKKSSGRWTSKKQCNIELLKLA